MAPPVFECGDCGRVRATANPYGPLRELVCPTCRHVRRQAARQVEQLDAMAAAVLTVEPDLPPESVRACLVDAAPDRRAQTLLARVLEADPMVLCAGDATPPVVIDRLVAALQAIGATSVRLPVCCVCGRSAWLTQRRGGLRLCVTCCQRARVERCGACLREARVHRRQPDGTARCATCARRDAARHETCADCQRVRLPVRRLPDGRSLCEACHRRTTKMVCTTCGRLATPVRGVRDGQPQCSACCRRRETCARCGRVRPVMVRLADGPACSTCYEHALLAKATCPGCGQRRRPDPRVTSGLCSTCAGLEPLQVCSVCGDETKIYAAGCCRRCALKRRVDELLSPAGTPLPEPIAVLRRALVDTDHPKAGLKWLARPHNHRFLSDLAAGTIPLTHAAVDALGEARANDHLRAVLVAAGALPPRDELLARLERWISYTVAAVEPIEDRHFIDGYANWWVLRRYRQRSTRAETTNTKSARRVILTAIELLGWLRHDGSSLADAKQPQIDRFVSGLSESRRRQVHEFLRWANQRKLTTVTVTRRPNVLPAAHPDFGVDERVGLIERLLNDDDLAIVDRVAGLFVLLYGQPLARICRMTLDAIGTNEHGEVTITLGTDPVVAPTRVGALVRRLADERYGHATVASNRGDDAWLFLGGQAGRHLGPDRLSVRLQRIGITARHARTNTLLDLAADTPLVVLADMLGMHPNTAARWIHTAAGDWSRYAAARAVARP